MKKKYCYVIYVISGKEDNVVRQLKAFLDLNQSFVFVPMMERKFKKNGVTNTEKVPLFPGYVFVESELPDRIFREQIMRIIYKTSNIIRLLGYGDSEEISLREHEKSALFILLNNDYYIENSWGIIEKGKLIIKEGPLKGMENKIIKIYRHKREALVEIRIMEENKQIKTGLEIVEKQYH